jgi:hypothetical protein
MEGRKTSAPVSALLWRESESPPGARVSSAIELNTAVWMAVIHRREWDWCRASVLPSERRNMFRGIHSLFIAVVY